MAARDLCALADVVRYTPGYTSVVGIDAQLAVLITSQSTEIYEDTDREFTPRTSNPSARVFELGWWELEERVVEIGDLASASLVEILDNADALIQTLDAGAYRLLPRVQDRNAWDPVTALELRRVAQAPAAPASLALGYQLRVTGTWGFPSIPSNVVEAVAKLVIVRYVNDIGADPEHNTGGDAFTEAAAELNIGALYASATATLKRWKDPVVAS